jgi:hypothetical protein
VGAATGAIVGGVTAGALAAIYSPPGTQIITVPSAAFGGVVGGGVAGGWGTGQILDVVYDK